MSSNMRFIEEKWSDDFAGVCLDSTWARTILCEAYKADGCYDISSKEVEDGEILFFPDSDRLHDVVTALTYDEAYNILEQYEGVSGDSGFSPENLEAYLQNLKCLVSSPSFERFATSDGISILIDG